MGQYVPGFHTLVLFDGTCNLCNASVDFLIRADRTDRLLFCAQQSPAARDILADHGHTLVPPAPLDESAGSGPVAATAAGTSDDTVLVLTPDGGLHEKSAAALQAGLVLPMPWRGLAQLGLWVPAKLLDLGYSFVGQNRYRWFGRKETCRVPTPAERHHFL